MNAVLTLLLASARSLRSLKCMSPDSSISVVDSFSRTKVSHVMDVQLFSCVQNFQTERYSFSKSLGKGFSLQMLYLPQNPPWPLSYIEFCSFEKRKDHYHCLGYFRPHQVQTVWWQTPSYLCYCDAIVDHFKAVFELSWDGQAHVDGELFKT